MFLLRGGTRVEHHGPDVRVQLRRLCCTGSRCICLANASSASWSVAPSGASERRWKTLELRDTVAPLFGLQRRFPVRAASPRHATLCRLKKSESRRAPWWCGR